MRVVIGLTHRPCGACAALVDLNEGCEHTRAPRTNRRRAQRERAARVVMVERSKLLGALGYPRP